MLLSSLLEALNINPAAEGGKATFQWATPEDGAGASSSAALEISGTAVSFNVSERYDGEPHPAISGTAILTGDSVAFGSDAVQDSFEQFCEAVSMMQRVGQD